MSAEEEILDRYSRGNTVVLIPQDTDERFRHEVFSAGSSYLHFLVASDGPAVRAFRRENRVILADPDGTKRCRGTIQIVDVGPSQYERVTSDASETPSPQQHLLRFQPTHRRVNDRWFALNTGRPFRVYAWIRALRLELLPATLIPVLLGLAYPLWMGWPVQVQWAGLALFAAIFMQLGANLHNDVSDHWRGVDPFGGAGGSGMIQKGWLSPRQVFRACIVCFLLGAFLGVPILWVRGWPLVVVSLMGVVGALGYSQRHFGFKYTALGDLCVFVLLGPLMVVGSCIAACGLWDGRLVAASVPIGFFVTLILHGNNVNDLHVDRKAGVRTLAMILGFRGSKIYYEVMMVAGYATIAVLVLMRQVPLWTLLSFVTLPLALRNVRRVRAAKNPSNPILARLRFDTVNLHLLVGLVYVGSFLMGSFL